MQFIEDDFPYKNKSTGLSSKIHTGPITTSITTLQSDNPHHNPVYFAGPINGPFPAPNIGLIPDPPAAMVESISEHHLPTPAASPSSPNQYATTISPVSSLAPPIARPGPCRRTRISWPHSCHREMAALMAETSEIEPTGFKHARENEKWAATMYDEIFTLHQNNTWTLVEKQPHMNVIGWL